MAIYLSNVNDAYGPLLTAHWEKKEDPQHYDYLTSQFVNPAPQRHILGIVGGNDVSLIKGNMVDLESDLRGQTRMSSDCPSKQYSPSQQPIKLDHQPSCQMQYYPKTPMPNPSKVSGCDYSKTNR